MVLTSSISDTISSWSTISDDNDYDENKNLIFLLLHSSASLSSNTFSSEDIPTFWKDEEYLTIQSFLPWSLSSSSSSLHGCTTWEIIFLHICLGISIVAYTLAGFSLLQALIMFGIQRCQQKLQQWKNFLTFYTIVV